MSFMKKKIYLALLILPFLTSCGLFSSPATGEIEITLNDDKSFDNYYSPEEVRIVDTYKTLQLQTGHIVMPSTGDVNVLVVPIIIRGYEETATESYLSLLDEAFNSTSPLKGGYPSVHTYYEESSFGKLNIHADILNWVDLWEYGLLSNRVTAGSLTQNQLINALRRLMENYVYKQDLDFSIYDKDKDGFLDQVYFIYSAYDYHTLEDLLHDYNQDVNPSAYNNDVFWSYTITTTTSTPFTDALVPELSTFTITSFDTLLTGYCDYVTRTEAGKRYEVPVISEDNNLSPQTIIHETGHALGLEDYYNYGDDVYYSPMGRLTMMDLNAGDFDTYSKLALGWIKPYLVYGNSKITLTSSSLNPNQCIVIDNNQTRNNFNPFDEFLLVEYYTPNGLNQYDINTVLNGYVPLPSLSGYKLYHVDNRAFIIRGGSLYKEYNALTDSVLPRSVVLPIVNTLSGERCEEEQYHSSLLKNEFDQIRLIEANGNRSFDDGGYFTSSTLFQGNNSFSVNKFSKYFINKTFNDGTTFDYVISFK